MILLATSTPTRAAEDCDVITPCAPNEFCELPVGVCATALDGGTCIAVADNCLDIFLPVCGCDGTTYGNDCERVRARVPKAHDGACSDEACSDACDCYATRTFATPCPLLCPSCGNFWTCEQGQCLEHCGMIPAGHSQELCADTGQCDPAEHCRKPIGHCEAQGACGSRPNVCPRILLPVCGCDGQSYGNDCEAAAAGVAVAHPGSCK